MASSPISAVHRRDSFASESPSSRLSKETQSAQPLPHGRHDHPRPLRFRDHQARPHRIPTSPARTRRARPWSACPSPERQLAGLSSPKPALAARFLAPSTEDAHASPPSPALSPPKHLQPKGIAVPGPPSSLRHKLGAVGSAAGVPKDSCAARLRARSEGPEGGSRRSPLTGTTPCLRRCSRVCPRVSVCRGAGLGEERGQGGGSAGDCYSALNPPQETVDHCKTAATLTRN